MGGKGGARSKGKGMEGGGKKVIGKMEGGRG